VKGKSAGRYPLGGYLFAAVPIILALSGSVLRFVSGAPPLPTEKPTETAPATAESTGSPGGNTESATAAPAAPSGPTQDEVIQEYSAGRISNARALAQSGQHAELMADLDTFERHYSLGLEARSAGRRAEALEHLRECLTLDRKLTNGRSALTPRLQRQIASLRPKTSRSKR
jgi:hypothetical protein